MSLALWREGFEYLASKLCPLLIYSVVPFICLIFLKETCDGGAQGIIPFVIGHVEFCMIHTFFFDIGHFPSPELILLFKTKQNKKPKQKSS